MPLLSRLSVSVFASLSDNDPSGAELSWPEDFAEWRETPNKESVPLWSPVSYREGGRRVRNETERNIETCSALVFDYDNDGDHSVTLDRAGKVWAPWEHVLYTTHANGLIKPPKYTGKPRFRVVIPLKRKVTTAEFRRVWAWAHQFASQAGAPFDPLADPGRIYFVPTHRPGSPPEYRHHAGSELLDPDEVLSVFSGEVPAAPPPTGIFSPTPSLPGGQATGIFSGIERSQQVERLDLIESRCAFMRHAREEAATLPQPEWYAWLSIVARCRDAEQHAHVIGSAHPSYSEAETADTLRRALTASGPRTCGNIRSMSAACQGCPQNVTSPVLLGRPEPETSTVEERREDAAARVEASTARAQAALSEAEALVARRTVEDATARTLAANAARFAGSQEAMEAAATRRAEAGLALRAAREAAREAREALRAAQVGERRAAATAQADPAVLEELTLDPRTGLPKSTLLNLSRIFDGDTRYGPTFFRHDDFAGKLYYGSRLAVDTFDTGINQDIESRYGFSSKTTLVQEAIMKQAADNSFHPVREYLDALEWDGESRLDALLSRGFGALGTPSFLADAGRKFAIGAVARIYEPGCQMDTMLVLTGKQGVGKSTGLRMLAAGWFADSPLPLGDKDSFMQLAGRWLYEISELDSFRKAENTRIKAFLSSRFDSFRPPFGRHVVERPRQTILVGTTNEEQFLNDPSGSRRFVPITVHLVDLAWVTEHRDQLWAEAVSRYRSGEIWHYEGVSASLLAKESRAYHQEDPWEPVIIDYLNRQRKAEVSVTDILTGGLCVAVPQIDKHHRQRVVHILRGLGCVESPLAEGQRSPLFTVPPDLRTPLSKVGPALVFSGGAS